MKFVLAPDSFKESMTAKEVAEAMERGLRQRVLLLDSFSRLLYTYINGYRKT